MIVVMNNEATEPVDDLAAAYVEGLTLEQLATRFGVSPGTARNRVRAAGIALRPPGRRLTVARVKSRPSCGPMARTSQVHTGAGSWYRILNAATAAAAPTTAEIYVFDEIGLYGVSAAQFVTELRAVAADSIDLHLNSPGGDVYDGVAIYNAIRSNPANVTVYVDGLAASIASVIAMAGDKVVMAPTATMMIHDAWGLCVGNAADMRDMAGQLDMCSYSIATIYHDKAQQGVKTWRARMQDETWYSADEAVAAKLADSVQKFPARVSNALLSPDRFDLTRYKYQGRAHAPAPALAGHAPAVVAEPVVDLAALGLTEDMVSALGHALRGTGPWARNPAGRPRPTDVDQVAHRWAREADQLVQDAILATGVPFGDVPPELLRALERNALADLVAAHIGVPA